jgi:uncharacterized protein YbjT (DUF2867 family)
MGENAVRRAVPNAVILRPGLMVGVDSPWVNLITRALKTFPFFPLIHCGLLQPVLVTDVARAVVESIERDEVAGSAYCVLGDKTYTLRDIVRLVAHSMGVEPRFVPLGKLLTDIMGYVLGSLPVRILLRGVAGSYAPMLTKEQTDVLSYDLVASEKMMNILTEIGLPVTSVAVSLSNRYY